jgi:hypothetical protein
MRTTRQSLLKALQVLWKSIFIALGKLNFIVGECGWTFEFPDNVQMKFSFSDFENICPAV